ncbi:MAG TPA: hypothetical protein VIK56_15475, partial [Rhodoferax sp.]
QASAQPIAQHRVVFRQQYSHPSAPKKVARPFAPARSAPADTIRRSIIVITSSQDGAIIEGAD